MNKTWKEIWGNKDSKIKNCKSEEELFMELKRLTGNDTTGKGVSYDVLMDRIRRFQRELFFSEKDVSIHSVFEVGCGSGANLRIFNQQGYDVGGMDYSNNLISVAKEVIDNPVELYCEEASNIDVEIKYDVVFSNSAFEYFENEDYARQVIEKMIEKSRNSVGILEIHDLNLKKDFIDFRRKTIEDYDQKYKDLKKLFISKNFFIDLAEKNNMDIKFTTPSIEGYWNTAFIYDVYLYKRK